MLLDDETGALTTVAGFGDELPRAHRLPRGDGIIGAIAASGIGEIVNDVDSDPRRVTRADVAAGADRRAAQGRRARASA